jgi:insertion element IS1 protein InsB
MDVNPRQVIAFHVGDHSPDSAKELWAKIPLVYREQATCHTDRYEAYQGMIPTVRHKAITKNARKTNHIKRFNNTLRRCVSRLVRETLSLSKSWPTISVPSSVSSATTISQGPQHYLCSTSLWCEMPKR